MIRLFSFAKRLFLSIKKYFFQNFLNSVVFCSQILIFISWVSWISINTADPDNNYEISKIRNLEDPSLFYIMETQAAKFDFYVKIQALTVFSLIIQTLKYFYFAKGISNLLNIFNNSKFDMLFYIFMFAIVLTAFSAMAFFSFGMMIDDFNTFPKALITCLFLLIGEFDLEELVAADAFLGPVFYFSYNVK